jgi:hypothetical protein
MGLERPIWGEIVEHAGGSDLIDAASAAALSAIAAHLPDRADTFGFEVRLTGAPTTVDLGIALTAAAGSHRLLASPDRDPRLSSAVRADHRWRRLSDFARRWAEPGSPWLLRVPFLFLEFDADGTRDPVPIPSVFVALDWPLDELTQETRQRCRRVGPSTSAGLCAAKEILHLLRGQPLSPAVADLLDRCFLDLPDFGVVLHVAAMLARPGAGVRLSVQLPRRAARRYLEALGWGAGAELEGLLDAHAGETDFTHPAAPVQVDFDVGASIGARVGIGLRPPDERGWPALLDSLVRRRRCDPAKRDALLQWPGVSFARLADSSDWCGFEHYIGHLKISCEVGREPQAKAYFGVTPRRVRGGESDPGPDS